MTVIFPDSTLPNKLDGGFKTQEEFKNFVLKFQADSRWDASLHAHPYEEKVPDFRGDGICTPFLRQFPFGLSGLPEDVPVKLIEEAELISKRPKRNDQKWLSCGYVDDPPFFMSRCLC